MPAVPAILLRRLYVEGSPRNTEPGFELALQNIKAPGKIINIGSVTVDRVAYGDELITVMGRGQPRLADRISVKARWVSRLSRSWFSVCLLRRWGLARLAYEAAYSRVRWAKWS